MMKIKLCTWWLLPAVVLTTLLTGCSNETKDTAPLIGISRSSDAYLSWLRSADSTIRYIDLYPLPLDSALQILDQCDGLLLTGGRDIFPGIYSDDPDTAYCGPFDLYRDTLEINLILLAIEQKLPIFGVCRGEQLLNAFFGGTLFTDLPRDLDTLVRHRCEDYLNCFHSVSVVPGSHLHTICGCDSGSVTTNHHQGIRSLAENLRAGAYSADGLIEAVELAEPGSYPFFLAVQWHPERMDPEQALSGKLAKAFLTACRTYQETHH